MNETPVETPLDPLAAPGVRRLLLSEAASRFLQESGEDCFLIVGKCSYPAIPGRWAIYLKPCPLAVANDACRVLAGTHHTTRNKPTLRAGMAATLTE